VWGVLLTPTRAGDPRQSPFVNYDRAKFFLDFLFVLWYALGNERKEMSNYEEGFQDGIRHFKDVLLEWADTFEGDSNGDGYTLFYEKLIEKLEQ
jgi:hypothetical protein